MAVPPKLTAKLERANQHIRDLQTEWNIFFQGGGYKVGFNDDPQAGQRTYYMSVAKELPVSIPLIIGDALQNLRSALDHLAHHLVAMATGKTGSILGVSFPIAESAAKYQSERAGKIQGIGQSAIDAIDAIEPYRGGAGHTLWKLNRLNNIDKHRLLLTVYGELLGHSIPRSQREQIIRGYRGSYPGKEPPDFSAMTIMPVRGTFAVKQGDTLLTTPLAELENYAKFTFDISFDEPEVAKGELVIATLNTMAQIIKTIFIKFDSLGLFT